MKTPENIYALSITPLVVSIYSMYNKVKHFITVSLKISNKLEIAGESVETVLTVTAPLKATVEPATQTVDFGRPAVFTCRYEGNPVKTITWLKDGKDMKHHDATLR